MLQSKNNGIRFRWYSIGTNFNNNADVQYFDEFCNFTGMIAVDYAAFSRMSNIKTLTIPINVVSIGSYMVSRSTKLERLTMLPTTPPSGTSIFANTTVNFQILVPASALETYKNNSYWGQFSAYIQAIPE